MRVCLRCQHARYASQYGVTSASCARCATPVETFDNIAGAVADDVTPVKVLIDCVTTLPSAYAMPVQDDSASRRVARRASYQRVRAYTRLRALCCYAASARVVHQIQQRVARRRQYVRTPMLRRDTSREARRSTARTVAKMCRQQARSVKR